MRDYGKVHTSFWTSPNIRTLSDDGKTLAIYLLTCPHSTLAGVFRLPDGYACEDLQWTPKRVQVTLTELLSNGFATRCEATKWVWVVKHLDWNPPENPNQRKAAAKLAMQVPDLCAWKAFFIGKCGESLGISLDQKDQKSEPLPNPQVTVVESGTGTGTEVNTILGGKPGKPSQHFDDFWGCWPKNDRKQDKGKCESKWKHDDLDESVEAILRDVKAKKKTRKWLDGYVEAPLVYLNNHRWQDSDMPSTSETDDWFVKAGFDTESEARNFGCVPSNSGQFHEGKKQELTA
jgi:hypothetical protein